MSRRTMLKMAAASTASAALFAGSARATDGRASVTVDCLGDTVRVTLSKITPYGKTIPRAAETFDGKNLQIRFGRFDVINVNDNPRVDVDEIKYCVDGVGWCTPLGRGDFDAGTLTDDGSLVYEFDLDAVGLGDVSEPTEVVLVGTYTDGSGMRRTFDSLEHGPLLFDPADCCTVCDTGTSLLVKYEWTDGTFEPEGGADSGITFQSADRNEDDEPTEACFSTSYCDLWAVVKAGSNYDVVHVREDSFDPADFCVSPTVDHAISNVQFFCEEPDPAEYVLGGGNDSTRNDDSGRHRWLR